MPRAFPRERANFPAPHKHRRCQPGRVGQCRHPRRCPPASTAPAPSPCGQNAPPGCCGHHRADSYQRGNTPQSASYGAGPREPPCSEDASLPLRPREGLSPRVTLPVSHICSSGHQPHPSTVPVKRHPRAHVMLHKMYRAKQQASALSSWLCGAFTVSC